MVIFRKCRVPVAALRYIGKEVEIEPSDKEDQVQNLLYRRTDLSASNDKNS